MGGSLEADAFAVIHAMRVWKAKVWHNPLADLEDASYPELCDWVAAVEDMWTNIEAATPIGE